MDDTDGIDFEEKIRAREEIKKAKQEARKEVKEEAKQRFANYKFKLNGI